MNTTRCLIGILVLAALFMPQPALAAEETGRVFLLDMELHQNHSITLHDFAVTDGLPKEPDTHGNYTIQARDTADAIIYNASFGRVFPSYAGADMSHHLFYRLPYDHRADTIRVMHRGETLHRIAVANRVCQADGTCPFYCDGRDDPDCGLFNGELEPSERTIIYYLIGIMFYVALAVYAVRKFHPFSSD